jgi:two-component system, NarL family, invasion response regulator UvrY
MKSLIKTAIADDHTIVRKGVIELINAFGDFEVVIEASNGRDLIQKIEKSSLQPDVCLLDVQMPEMNGYEAALELKSRWPKIKVLALSMYDNEQAVIKMLKNGALGYILKETDPKELREALLQVYEGNYYHSEVTTSSIKTNQKAGKPLEMNITEREMAFLPYCCTDLTYKEISEKMNLSVRTIEGYRDTLFQKFNIKSRSGLVVLAMSMGLCK